MYKIVRKEQLNNNTFLIEIESSMIAKHAKAGQFVIVRPYEDSERIPLTIANYTNNTITIIFQVVGETSFELSLLNQNSFIQDVCGPLGLPTNISNISKSIVVGGGVGCAIAYPLAKALKRQNSLVISILGFRSKDLIILENEFKLVSDQLIIMSDDGSYGQKGFVTKALEELLEKDNSFDEIFVIGPLIMMKNVALLTKKYNIKTSASMNPIMIDGTGMCGCCRLTVDGKMKFSCVDGPDFDAHLIDFDEAIFRNKQYLLKEKNRYDHVCNLLKDGNK